ncbi:MAG: hypothetical protein LP071_00655 [Candidatus Nanogingivalaceae bacterium]|nr:hypothetical protein [Candidatus Nanogingivalaceae bacterium]
MQTKDIVLLAVTLLILGEVSYLLARLPKNSIKSKDRAILVDTSVLMDGRIAAVAQTGFIGGTLVIPRSVIGELQFLADHADADKRARARYGLDVVTELQAMERVDVELLQDGSRAREGVDDRLLKLAKQHGAVIMTLDYNLNKVAAVEGTEVLNLNELAQSIRMEHLPGEKITLEIIQKGQDAHQGVGYLPDGTMVVVDQANSQIGQTLDVEIVRNLQTAAGRMIFAKKIDTAGKTAKSASNTANSTQKSAKASAKTASAKQRSAGRARSQSPSTSSRDSAKKSNETRVQVAPKQSRRTNSPKAKSQPKPAADSLRRQNNRRRADHESDLIDLVNNQ